MAIDIVEALTHSTNFDEFVIFSADADFTPVLRRIREHDRQTLVVSSSRWLRPIGTSRTSSLTKQV